MVSNKDTGVRLPGEVVPRHYGIELTPDLTAATFAGSVAVDIDIVSSVTEIVCNAAELDITGAHLVTEGASVELDAAADATTERLTLTRRDGLDGFEPGSARLMIDFNGVLNDQLRGFYRSTYDDDAGNTHVIATTQFESTDARRAFPCWDEPALKATFDVALVVPEGLLAVSNTAESGREPAGEGLTRVRFATTMRMSTYLVAFVVGELEATEPIDCDGVPLRVIHRPGRGDQTGFALDVAAHALAWFSDYYDLPYPSDKLDLVAIPDFASGAMENLGCVTFREVLLLVDPSAASQPELQRIAQVVNHEIAHMWFGDLVTMQWWEGIWLNEAFATFMETACTDAYKPSWRVWSTFSRGRAAAMSTDALTTTRPVEYPVRSPDEAEDMFDIITYEKGAALLLMLEQYLGEEAFRDGVRLYLRRHAYSSTVTADLWEALGEASNRPVREIMHEWIYQGGYPEISAQHTEHGLELTQRHFTLDPSRADNRTWKVPVRLRMSGADGSDRELVTLLDRSRSILTAAQGTVISLNSGATGFYRTKPSSEDLRRFCESGRGHLSADERHTLVDDAWATTLAGGLEASSFLQLVADGFADERDLTVWQAIAAAMGHIRRIIDDDAVEPFETLVIAASESASAELGLDPASGKREDERTRQLRATLLALRGATAAHAQTIAACRERLDHPDPTLAAAALVVVACHGDADDFAGIKHRYETAADPQSEQRNLAALADFPHPDLVYSILQGAFDGSVRSQDAPYLIRRALANHRCGESAWEFLTLRWDDIVDAFPSNSVARMLDGVAALDRPELAARVSSFLAEHPVPQGAKQVAQHLERLDINVALRTRESKRLTAALLAL